MPVKKLWRRMIWVCAVVALFSSAGCSDIKKAQTETRVTSNITEGDRQMTLGNRTEAHRWYDRAIALDPHDVRVYVGFGDGSLSLSDSLSQHGAYSDLAAYLATAVADPKQSNSWLLYSILADTQNRLGQKAEAKASYTAELALLNQSYTQKGTIASQLQPYQFIIQKAGAEWGAGQHDVGRADFLRVIKSFPQYSAEAENDLAYSEAEANINLPEALDLAQKAVNAAQSSNNTEDDGVTTGNYLDTLGWTQYRLGKYQEARSNLEQAISYIPREPVAHFHLGKIYRALHQNDDALIELNRSALLNPEDPATQEELRTLKPTAAPPVQPHA